MNTDKEQAQIQELQIRNIVDAIVNGLVHPMVAKTQLIELIIPTPPLEENKNTDKEQEIPDEIKKQIEEAALKEEIYPAKYGSGSREGYSTMMLYEINYERSECFEKGAIFGYQLASTPPLEEKTDAVEDRITAEEVMLKHIPNGCVNLRLKGAGNGKPQYEHEKRIIIAAMEEYASQFKSQPIKEDKTKQDGRNNNL